jgi:hypothetical protein
MNFFKKNPFFTTILIGLVFLFITSISFTLFTENQIKKARQEIKTKLSQLKHLAQETDPSPEKENLFQAQTNLNELKTNLAAYIKTLKKSPENKPITEGLPKDSLNIYFSIKTLQTQLHYTAAKINIRTNTTAEQDLDNRKIKLKKDEAFSFDFYIERGDGPPSTQAQTKVYIQRQIIDYLIKKLFLAVEQTNDQLELLSVLREPIIEEEKETRKGLFNVDEEVSAKVSGLIDPMGFQISFIAGTKTLRNYLTSITAEQLPLIVRNIEVKRIKKEAPIKFRISRYSDRKYDLSDDLDSREELTNTPIVKDTQSQFTITLEYLHLIEEEENERRQDL